MTDGKPARPWPLILIALPAAVSIWGGWVGLGGMAGFGPVRLLPGIAPHFAVNLAILLPVGVEAYGAYALGAWLRPGTPAAARAFARWSAVGSLVLGGTGQVAYHLLAAFRDDRAPVPVIVVVSCIPVVALGFGAALAHLLRGGGERVPAPSSGHELAGLAAPLVTALAARIAPKDGSASGTGPGTAPAPPPAAAPAPVRQPARLRPRQPDRQSAAAKRGRWAQIEAANPGMSAADVAARTGVHPRTVERWRGQAVIAEAERVAASE